MPALAEQNRVACTASDFVDDGVEAADLRQIDDLFTRVRPVVLAEPKLPVSIAAPDVDLVVWHWTTDDFLSGGVL